MMDNKKYKNFKVGAYTYGKPKVYASPNSFSIGNFCSIAANVVIYTGAEHRIDWITTYNFEKFEKELQGKTTTRSKGNVNIGNDVWICDGALILSGVNVGNGAVIGANAVVTKDVEAYSIVAGNPAAHIKYRFNKIQIEKLLSIKWWNWDIEKIKENFVLILNSNIDDFLSQHYKI